MEEEEIEKLKASHPLYGYLVYSVERALSLLGDIANSVERGAVALEPKPEPAKSASHE